MYQNEKGGRAGWARNPNIETTGKSSEHIFESDRNKSEEVNLCHRTYLPRLSDTIPGPDMKGGPIASTGDKATGPLTYAVHGQCSGHPITAKPFLPIYIFPVTPPRLYATFACEIAGQPGRFIRVIQP